jgi:hypothetical protein
MAETKWREVPDVVRAYMSELGKTQTPAKEKASRENLAKGAEARRRDPLTLVCTCSGGDSLEASAHKTTCPRGRLLYQRKRAAEKKATTST